ncbi:MAG: DUF4249 family protein [Rhodothermales bacterium]|nr:DUF4249 family protein [Rhodothermales bacterium]
MIPLREIAVRATLICVIGFIITGCENSFTPFAEKRVEILSINGFLDADVDTQFVRVAIIRNEIEQVASLNDSLSVELRDLNTAAVTAMTDSLVSLGDGERAHLFFTDIPILGDRDYRITATGPGGGTSAQQTTVPGRIAFARNTATNGQGTGQYVQTLTFANLPLRPESVDVVYTVLRNGTGDAIRVVIPYRDLMVQVPTISGYQLTVRLEQDRITVLSVLGLPIENGTTVLQNVSLEYALLSDEWRIPRNPNRLDFFASAASYVEEWTLPESVLDDMGYATP